VSDATRDPAVAEVPAAHPEMEVHAAADGGFEIRSGSRVLDLRPRGEGWEVRGTGALKGWTLARGGEIGVGFRLLDADGSTEAGRTAWLDRAEAGAAVECTVLLGDGRMFRIVPRGPADPRYEVLGWETPGAYLTARIADGVWLILPEPACSGLREIRPLVILLAAELLDTD
jgi:hypothetical protein